MPDSAPQAPAASAAAQLSRLPLGPRAAYALALLTGLLYFLGFPGIDLWPLSLVALAPLCVALEGQSPKRGLVIGLIAGFTMNMLGFYWLYGMLRTFSGFPGPVCVLFMSILCAYQGGRIGLCGLLYALARRKGWPRTPVFALAFATSELTYPLLFPWFFGASAHTVPLLSQAADLGGPYLVGLVLAAPSLGIAEWLLARLEHRRVPYRLVAAALTVPIVAVAYGAVRIHQVDRRVSSAEPLNVGIVQGDMPLVPAPDERNESLQRHLRMTRELKDKGAELVVWSEAAVMQNIPADDYDAYVGRLFSRRLGVSAIFGAVLHDRRSSYGRAFNVALSTDPSGRTTGRYDKQFLLAFGEYLPFGDTFPVLYQWSPNSGRLSPGESIEPLSVLGHPVTALVCYEDIIPSFVNRAVSHASPDLLVNLTNDAWFGDTTEPWIHLALAKMRAIEHRRFLVRSTNSGVSAVIDPVGRTIAHGGTFRPETVQATVRWLRGAKTGYELWGDVPWWLAAAGLAAMILRRRTAAVNA